MDNAMSNASNESGTQHVKYKGIDIAIGYAIDTQSEDALSLLGLKGSSAHYCSHSFKLDNDKLFTVKSHALELLALFENNGI